MLGVLGGGQLGAMFAIAARRMGYRVCVFSDKADVPAARYADRFELVSYRDTQSLTKAVEDLAVVTFEFENVPAEAASAIAKVVPVHPSAAVLHTTQDRIREKAFLVAHGLPCVAHRPVVSLNELTGAIAEIGTPAVLKTSASGYDGKGQYRIETSDQCATAWTILATDRAILEEWIEFELECSVVVARSSQGAIEAFAPSRNQHTNHILDVSVSPSGLPMPVEREAMRQATVILEAMDFVGVACIEFFVTKDGRVLVNEIAPRPHNSGHLTIDACVSSQFEQQVRSICNLPLGSTAQSMPAAMANLLGDCWKNGDPDWAAALSVPGVRLFLYGKTSATAGRKMGHLTALAATSQEALHNVTLARSLACRMPS